MQVFGFDQILLEILRSVRKVLRRIFEVRSLLKCWRYSASKQKHLSKSENSCA